METSKREIVKNLSNKKIVLGNGFDLFCGLKTSYSDFFESQKENYHSFKGYVDAFKQDAYGSSKYYFRGEENHLNKVLENTIWDLVFYLLSNQRKETKWCDIEMIIKNTFIGKKPISWKMVLELLQNKNTMYSKHKYENICAHFLKNKYKAKDFNIGNIFYDVLLEELILFEHKFGEYIQFEQQSKQEYFDNSVNTLIKFTDRIDQILSIDTFNYSNISSDKRWRFTRINNINGTIENPIFGFFSPEIDPLSNEHRFTKSHRRTLALFKKDYNNQKDYFENLVVFGHSMNEQDYNYFFPLFDELELADPIKESKLIIAYTIYDLNKKKEIIEELAKRIIKMIYEYEKHTGSTSVRLYDKLLCQKRIIFYEIDSGNENINYFYSINNDINYIESDSYMDWSD